MFFFKSKKDLLFSAVWDDDTDKAKDLISKKPALVNSRSNTRTSGSKGKTPLMSARSISMADVLIDHGADVNATDTIYNNSVLYCLIVNYRDPSLIKYLISKGANANYTNPRNVSIVDLVDRIPQMEPDMSEYCQKLTKILIAQGVYR